MLLKPSTSTVGKVRMKLRTACRTLGSGASALHAEHALLLSCFPNMPLPLHSSLGNSSGSKTPVPCLSQPSQPSTWFLLGRENMVTMQQTHIPNLYVWELCDPEVTTQEKSDASCAQARKAAAVKDNLQHSCLMLTLDLCQQIHQSITKLYKHSEAFTEVLNLDVLPAARPLCSTATATSLFPANRTQLH